MISWILQSSIISFILIFLIHYLFLFFKENLTVPKVIDLVNRPKEQYEVLLKNTSILPSHLQTKSSPSNTSLNAQASASPISASTPDMSSMKDELKNYLRDLKGKTAPSEPQSMSTMDTSQYSAF